MSRTLLYPGNILSKIMSDNCSLYTSCDSHEEEYSGKEISFEDTVCVKEEEECGVEAWCHLELNPAECNNSNPNCAAFPAGPLGPLKVDKIPTLPEDTITDAVIKNPSTCELPCTDEWPGYYNFEILVDGLSSSRKTWLFSIELNKVFIDVNQSIPLQIKVDNKYEDDLLYVRAVAIYNVAQYMSIPVKRCPNHLEEDKSRGFENIHHVVKCSNKNSIYEYDVVSERYSVLVPLEHPPAGSDVTTLMYSVACKGSCIGGMNRRPVTLIFTLEKENQQVVGRRLLNIRVCSCPKRDKRKEENEKREEIGTHTQKPCPKKKKTMKPKPQTPTVNEPVPKKIKSLTSSFHTPEDPQCYNIQVSGTEHYIEVLRLLIRLKTCDWVETKSSEDWYMKEEYQELLEKALKGRSS